MILVIRILSDDNKFSLELSCLFVDLILHQHDSLPYDIIDSQFLIFKWLSQAGHQGQVDAAQSVLACSSSTLHQVIECCQDKGVSWISALPLEQYGISEVCHDVQIEPHLQPLTGEILCYKSAVQADDVRVDIRIVGFWGCRHHHSFFDVRVFNVFAESNISPLV